MWQYKMYVATHYQLRVTYALQQLSTSCLSLIAHILAGENWQIWQIE